jgi:hypothetical protein
LEYGGLIIISSDRRKEIAEILFNASYLEKVIATRRNYKDYSEEMARTVEEMSSPHMTYHHGVVYFKGILWIPSDVKLRMVILESEHDSKSARHNAQDKTIELMR